MKKIILCIVMGGCFVANIFCDEQNENLKSIMMQKTMKMQKSIFLKQLILAPIMERFSTDLVIALKILIILIH